MTLTHILPSLRRTLADPLVRDHWPAFTVTTPTDVAIAGLSLVRLVEWCGTPSIHTGDAVVPGSDGRPSETRLASVIVARVTSAAIARGVLSVWIDAELGNSIPLMEDARLIGRASTAHTAPTLVFSATPHSPVHRGSSLPVDIVEGDLVAIPCVGVTTLRALRGSLHDGLPHPDAAADEREQEAVRCAR